MGMGMEWGSGKAEPGSVFPITEGELLWEIKRTQGEVCGLSALNTHREEMTPSCRPDGLHLWFLFSFPFLNQGPNM